MHYAFEADLKNGYLHIRIRGNNDPETIRRYLQDVLTACAREECPNALIEERLEGARLAVGDIFSIISDKSGAFRPAMRLVAYVDANAAGTSNMKFAENAAVNRGVTVRVFSAVADAEKWLRKQIGGGPGTS